MYLLLFLVFFQTCSWNYTWFDGIEIHENQRTDLISDFSGEKGFYWGFRNYGGSGYLELDNSKDEYVMDWTPSELTGGASRAYFSAYLETLDVSESYSFKGINVPFGTPGTSYLSLSQGIFLHANPGDELTMIKDGEGVIYDGGDKWYLQASVNIPFTPFSTGYKWSITANDTCWLKTYRMDKERGLILLFKQEIEPKGMNGTYTFKNQGDDGNYIVVQPNENIWGGENYPTRFIKLKVHVEISVQIPKN